MASMYVPVPGGESGDERYVLDLKKSSANASDTYHIHFKWGIGGRVKLNRVRIERLDQDA
jgi:hypothetical protein